MYDGEYTSELKLKKIRSLLRTVCYCQKNMFNSLYNKNYTISPLIKEKFSFFLMMNIYKKMDNKLNYCPLINKEVYKMIEIILSLIFLQKTDTLG